MALTFRLADFADIPALESLIPLSARVLQSGHYTPAQLDGAIGPVFGLDSQLIRDGTYFVAVTGDTIAGCGGWSFRKTTYGGDRGKPADDTRRDPRTEPAIIRAFFVHPDFTRRGIGREIVRLSEEAARAAGYATLEIAATLAGEPLYAACGYVVTGRYDIPLAHGLKLPVVRMMK